MDKETQKVYEKYRKMFSGVDKIKFKVNDDLLKNIAFMTITLYKLQNEIDEKGVIEKFEQGKQKFLRENPALKSYNSTIKNYTSAIKQLNELIPENTPKQAGEELLKFIAGGNIKNK